MHGKVPRLLGIYKHYQGTCLVPYWGLGHRLGVGNDTGILAFPIRDHIRFAIRKAGAKA